jgi:hypothetical protein
MITKRDAEIVEQIVCSMSESEYWGLVGWLSGGGEGPLWECMPRMVARRPRDAEALRGQHGQPAI